jgi:hypothetical protein
MTTLQNAWVALIGFHAGLLPVVILYRRMLLPRLFAPVSKVALFMVASSGLLAGVILVLLWPFLGISSGFAARLAALGLSEAVWLPFILYFTLINPWLEEAYWRIILFSPSHFLAPVDFLFAGYHLIILSLFLSIYWSLLGFTILVLAGWFWRQISRYTDSLLPAVFAHTLADLSILLVLFHFAM